MLFKRAAYSDLGKALASLSNARAPQPPAELHHELREREALN